MPDKVWLVDLAREVERDGSSVTESAFIRVLAPDHETAGNIGQLIGTHLADQLVWEVTAHWLPKEGTPDEPGRVVVSDVDLVGPIVWHEDREEGIV